MKYLIKYSYLVACISLLFTLESCVKNRNDLATDFGSIQPIVELRDNISGVGNDAGLANFGKATLIFTGDPHVQSFYVNLASVNVRNQDLKVTLAVDQNALDAYNADPNNVTKFELMPDSVYSFTQTEVTIPSGLRIAKDSVIFYPSKIDPTKSYMLPISVSDASGLNISGNFGTIYYHLIGNPLAGNYTWDFLRWSNPDQAGDPDGFSFTGGSTTFFPTSPTSFEVASGYYIQPRYEVSFTDNGGNLSDFQVELNQDDVDLMAGAGVVVTDGPNILVADPVNKRFEFQYKTLTRYVIDKYYR